jgi:phosphohistidine phosphatase
MKTIYLVRHAKSSWKNPQLDDIDRPLNKRGKRDAPFMGKLLKEKGIRPDLMITSPAKRAYSTAEYFASEINYPLKEIQTNKDLYDADADNILTLIKKTDDNIKSIMIFGHNPGLTNVQNFICKKHIDNIPTSAVVSLGLNVDHWNQIKQNSCELEFFGFPQKYLK